MLHELLEGSRSLLFPTSCAGCSLPLAGGGDPLCPTCLGQLPWSAPRGPARIPGESWFLNEVVSPFHYEGVLKELVTALKYRQELVLVRFLARFLTQAIQERLGPDPTDLLVPVPLFSSRLRERGFNQAQLLAEQVARNLATPCRLDLLSKKEPTRAQTNLPRRVRLMNVRRSFKLRTNPLIRHTRILLIDDVTTTGATANACAKALKEGGANRVVLGTIAHG